MSDLLSTMSGRIVTAGSGNTQVAIRLFGFERVLKAAPDGTPTWTDYVVYSPAHTAELSKIRSAVSRIDNLMPLEDVNDPVQQAAYGRRACIMPEYRRWSSAEPSDIQGTPLSAWLGLDPAYLPHLREAGFYTVEALAEANDSLLGNIKTIPNARSLRTQAQNFVRAKDANAALAAQQAVISENEALKEQLSDMQASIDRLLAQMAGAMRRDAGDDGELPKRRGRPPKVNVGDELVDAEAA